MARFKGTAKGWSGGAEHKPASRLGSREVEVRADGWTSGVYVRAHDSGIRDQDGNADAFDIHITDGSGSSPGHRIGTVYTRDFGPVFVPAEVEPMPATTRARIEELLERSEAEEYIDTGEAVELLRAAVADKP